MEEYQEVDILWPELEEDQQEEENKAEFDARSTTLRARAGTSAPILIPSRGPVSQSWTAGFNYNYKYGGDFTDMNDDDDEGDDYNIGGCGGGGRNMHVVVPPHILVSKRYADKMPFSVCIGNGRKLKGRQQAAARISILRSTGYLEK
ncbi:Senescence regulator [Carex littledalei]|uniref:Senescence regulator n=1 Tax=Carex littledalei TaxID=544730 RepID=A0A833VDE6_9POAL|nr:Senescence regulator [Carex littledalei]